MEDDNNKKKPVLIAEVDYYKRKAEMEAPYIEGCKIFLDINEREARQILKIYAKVLINAPILEGEYPEINEKRIEFANKLEAFIIDVENTIDDQIRFDERTDEKERIIEKNLYNKRYSRRIKKDADNDCQR